MTYRVSVFFYLCKVALRFEVGNYLFSCLIAVKSGVFAAFFGYFALAVDNEYRIKIMTSADFKVVGVVCGSYLNRACAEALFNVFVRYYGYFSAYKRENKLFADFVFIAFVIWIYRNGSVAEKCFWTCCCDDYFTASTIGYLMCQKNPSCSSCSTSASESAVSQRGQILLIRNPL